MLCDGHRCNDTLTTGAGEQWADALIAAVPSRAWQRLSTGGGAHVLLEYRLGPRWQPGCGHWLLGRRSLTDPEEIAYDAC